MAKKKFYAVKVGKKPGIYQSWGECYEQVKGFSRAKYKGFATIEEAREYLTPKRMVSSDELYDETQPYAFIDGSFNENTGIYGFGGFLKVDGRFYMLQGSGKDPELASMRNVAGEIAGSMAAIQLAEELNITHLQLLYDYIGIKCWATGEWKANKTGTKAYKDFMTSPNRTVQIDFIKVKSHSGIEENEIADFLAKESAEVELTTSEQRQLNEFKGLL